LADKTELLVCGGCGGQFPVSGGIPNLSFFPQGTPEDEFNQVQATYEAELHDQEAESNYEQTVLNVFGTKTRLMAQNWADTLGGAPTQRILDYGCGTGQLSRVLGLSFQPVYGFDISPVSVHKNVIENGVLGCVANGFALPFRDQAFDAVCINGVLHHIVDLPGAVAEICRVTKKRVYISEGIPRGRPGLGRVSAYPSLKQKALYALYALWWNILNAGRIPGRVLRKIGVLARSAGAEGDAHVSKYERPLDPGAVESLFVERGFQGDHLLYWTNVDYSGDGSIKRFLTKAFVNGRTGTHFDLQLSRKDRT
jgi:ubiquinone/menaquinone biosynthesis C-methylase UbiE